MGSEGKGATAGDEAQSQGIWPGLGLLVD
jgi:hypothetical protein